ncbi:MAG TPA: hypothetical protein DEP72_03890 [Clostridiales bacterium]|nr:MAG: hypothetical protein A2Y18_04165 [Clostridiales bacterium GWD2_32_19]HCC07288.1 hypothetical protein [Clostridiales bacterium]
MIKQNDAIFIGRPSRSLILIELIFIATLFVLLFTMLFFFNQFLNIQKNWDIFNYLCYSLLGFLSLFRMIKVMIKVYSVQYTLTEQVLEIKTGLLNIRTDIIQLYRIKDMSDFQPFFYRFYNIGDILIISTDISHPNMTLSAIDDFKGLKNQIRELVENTRGNAVLETI